MSSARAKRVIRLAPLPFVHANWMVERFEDPRTWMASYSDRIHLIEDAPVAACATDTTHRGTSFSSQLISTYRALAFREVSGPCM